jgi:N6-L-threonylcarbamoyladenine synthase
VIPNLTILGIESSCDETSAAVITGLKVRSNIVASQELVHQKWGGVVPEVASRAHVEAIIPVIEEALSAAGVSIQDIDGICVTNRPGLAGALSVGVAAAKALSYGSGKPLLGVHHLEGHLLSPLANLDALPEFPMLSLVVSGGHTELVRLEGIGRYQILAETVDDAAGEAFDKGARLLGLGYPGGKAIQDAAIGGDPKKYQLPVGLRHEDDKFSFSGLKTAVLRLTESEQNLDIPSAAASLQRAIVKALLMKVEHSLDYQDYPSFSLVGGVAANLALRESMALLCASRGIQFLVPEMSHCTDNAAMIGIAGLFRIANGETSAFDLRVFPNSAIPGLT